MEVIPQWKEIHHQLGSLRSHFRKPEMLGYLLTSQCCLPVLPPGGIWVQDSEAQLTDCLLAWDGLGMGLYQHKADSVPRLAQPFAAWPHAGGCTLVTGCGTAGMVVDTSEGRHEESTEKSACCVRWVTRG